MPQDANTLTMVDLLVQVAKLDTVYRDVYLRRARQLLSPTFDESAYRAIGSTEKEIDDLMGRSRTAVLHRDWAQAAEISGRVDSLRQQIATMGKLANLGKEVYEADAVAFDPFSPGKHLGPHARAGQADLRTQLINTLLSLAKMDTGASAFYEKRRGYFSGLALASTAASLKCLGWEILENTLGLDPLEFRFVCIPHDLYTHFGRERGFGKWPHWTHFDGYQVMGGNRLRALAGGDGRFGGLSDLVSISPSDARDGVYARFAVVRRARMTLRWR